MGRGKRSPRKSRPKDPKPTEPRPKEPTLKASLKATHGRTLVAALAVFIAAGVAMGPGLSGELLNWDDDRFIQNNELIRGFSSSAINQIFAEPHFEAYHPLHLLSYMFDFELYGLWAPGYKLHNFALYLLCLVLMYQLLRRLGLGALGAWVATLLFAVHPLHVETVVWVTARKESLSLALMLGAALSYTRSKSLRDRAGLLTVVLFTLALLTKTSTVVLPAFLFVLDVILRKRPWREAAVHLLPLALVALVVGLYVVSLWEENEMARPMPSRGVLGLIALSGKTGFHYLSKIVWPTGLSPVYPIDREGAFDLWSIAGFASWALILAAAFRSRDRLLLLAVVWTGIALLPVSNLVPVYFYVQDRYALIATVGAALAIGRLTELSITHSILEGNRRWLAWCVVVGVAVALGATSARQASRWRTSLSLWQTATESQPEAYYAFLALGHTERDRGEFDAAVEAYSHAVALEPSLPFARVSLCLSDALRNAERHDRPRSEVDQIGAALRQRWASPPQLLEFAVRISIRGYHGCAQLAESRAFDLRHPEADDLIRAASRWALLGQPQLALRYLDRATTDDSDPNATALEVEAQALELLGRQDDARATLRRSLELQPRPEQRLLEAARQLAQRERPELALLYADVASTGEGELAEEWAQLRQSAEGARRGAITQQEREEWPNQHE